MEMGPIQGTNCQTYNAIAIISHKELKNVVPWWDWRPYGLSGRG